MKKPEKEGAPKAQPVRRYIDDTDTTGSKCEDIEMV